MINFDQVSRVKNKSFILIENNQFKFKVKGMYSLLWDLPYTLVRLFIICILMYKICEFYEIIMLDASTYLSIIIFLTLVLVGVKLFLEKPLRKYIYGKGAFTLKKVDEREVV